MTTVEFAHFSLHGERFELPGAPLDALPELAVYKDLIKTAARYLWLKDHPGREKVPNGFYEEFDLRIEAVQQGSTTFPVVRVHETSFDHTHDYAYRARDWITELVGELPSTKVDHRDSGFALVLQDLGRLGKSLHHDSDFIVVGHPSDADQRAVVNQEFLAIVQELEEEFSPIAKVSVVGRIVEMDKDESTFMLRTAGKERIACRAAPGQIQLVHNAMDPDAPGWVRVTGIGHRKQGVVRGFASEEEVHVTPVPTEAVEYLELRLAGIAEALAHDADARTLQRELRRGKRELLSLAATYPSIGAFPMEDGSVEIETVVGTCVLSATLEVDGSVYMHSYDQATDESEELSTHLNWAQVVSFLVDGQLPGGSGA